MGLGVGVAAVACEGPAAVVISLFFHSKRPALGSRASW